MTKMTMKIIIIVTSILAIPCLIVGGSVIYNELMRVSSFFVHKPAEIHDPFVESLKTTLRQTDLSLLQLSDVTPFDWDKVYVFTPYTRNEVVRVALGNAVDPREIEMRDDICLVVFTKGEEVVHTSEVSPVVCIFRYPESYPYTQKACGIDREAAIFRLHHTYLEDSDWWEATFVYGGDQ